MPRTETIEKTVYKFEELDDRAKEQARDWFRAGQLDYDWYDSVYEDASECGKILGIDLNQKPVKLMGGGMRYDPAIYFSGFSSQGDGACFEGTYSYAKGAAKGIREHVPQDRELHRIADELQMLQRKNFYRAKAWMKHRGHYNHSGCMNVDTQDANGFGDEALVQLMRDFADWIYRQLEKECEWLQSDENVDDSIRANEYEFDSEGNRS